MPKESEPIGSDHAGATGPRIVWGFGSAGWTVAYSSDAPAPSEDDPEALALRFWNTGGRDEAVAFLESQIAREPSHAEHGVPAPGQARNGAGRAAAVSVCSSATAAGPVDVVAVAASSAEQVGASRQLTHIVPEPRIGDPGHFRRAVAKGLIARPIWIIPASLVIGAVAIGAAFWPDSNPTLLRLAEPARPIATSSIQPSEGKMASWATPNRGKSRAAEDGSAASPDLISMPGTSPAPEPVPPPLAFPEEPSIVESAPAAIHASLGQGARVETAPQSVVAARAEPMIVAPPQTVAAGAIPTARLPNPRPRLADRRPIRKLYERPNEVAAYTPRREYYTPERGDEYPADVGYHYLPPGLAERRAAAARYLAARRAASERIYQSRRLVVLEEAPVLTIEEPGHNFIRSRRYSGAGWWYE